MTDPKTPSVGLLLDVDGPIASPVERAVVQPSIIPDLISLLGLGIPIVFNTGRSDEFLRKEVVEPLQTAGIPEGALLFGVCEKGAVWFEITSAGLGPIEIDSDLSVPSEYGRRIEAIVDANYSDMVFFDHSKRAMVSVEQHVHVQAETYLAMRDRFDSEAFDTFADMGLGASWKDQHRPGANGTIDYRVDPTIISTDIESVVLGKDRGAERALELLTARDVAPRSWRTVGDSRTDYAMADWLHGNGHDVAHVDVRPADGVMQMSYPVFVPTSTVNDVAGAIYLRRVLQRLEGSQQPEEDFDL